MGVRSFVRNRKQVQASKASMNGDAGKLEATKRISLATPVRNEENK
jgi:hypothetical protein